MHKKFSERGFADYMYWQTQDRKTLNRINNLLKDIDRNGYNCIGKPEPLKGEEEARQYAMNYVGKQMKDSDWDWD